MMRMAGVKGRYRKGVCLCRGGVFYAGQREVCNT